jgi:hypothetical protein
MRHLAAIAREAGLREFTAEVLPHNKAMLQVFEKSGLRVGMKRANPGPCTLLSSLARLA